MGTTVTKRKYQTTSKHFVGDDSDSDSYEHVRLQKDARQLWKSRHTYPPNPVLAAAELESLASVLLIRQTPNPVHNTSITRSPNRKRALNDRVKTRYTVKRKTQASAANRKRALELRSDSFRTSGNCRPKRIRWSSSISTTLWGSYNLDHQPTQRHRQGTQRREYELWTRSNQ